MVRRREFMAGLGGLAAFSAMWPLAARPQQRVTPLVGWLGLSSPDDARVQNSAIRRGLAETGFIAGQNLTFDWEGCNDRH